MATWPAIRRRNRGQDLSARASVSMPRILLKADRRLSAEVDRDQRSQGVPYSPGRRNVAGGSRPQCVLQLGGQTCGPKLDLVLERGIGQMGDARGATDPPDQGLHRLVVGRDQSGEVGDALSPGP